MNITTVNYHLVPHCNAKCTFCFATFPGIPKRDQPSFTHASKVLDAISDAGATRVNFAGGEPTLHPQLGELIRHAKRLGLATSIVTNGAKLAGLLEEIEPAELDWVALSVDSASDRVNMASGRSARPGYAAKMRLLASQLKQASIGIKLNTVVFRDNWQENFSYTLDAIRPTRWKVFQALPVIGQNDARLSEFVISSEQFSQYIDRHAEYRPVAEDNEAMTDSYAMIDPLGRCFGNTKGIQIYSAPISQVGLIEGLRSVGFDEQKLTARDGEWEWSQSVEA